MDSALLHNRPSAGQSPGTTTVGRVVVVGVVVVVGDDSRTVVGEDSDPVDVVVDGAGSDWPAAAVRLVVSLSSDPTQATSARSITTASQNPRCTSISLPALTLPGHQDNVPKCRRISSGPFVMNTRAEIIQAIDDFNSGKMGSIPALRS